MHGQLSDCCSQTQLLLLPVRQAALRSRSYLDGVDVLANATEVLVDTWAACIDLLWIHTVLGVQVLYLTTWVYPVEAWGELELVAQLSG